jgi:hypothetical protein
LDKVGLLAANRVGKMQGHDLLGFGASDNGSNNNNNNADGAGAGSEPDSEPGTGDPFWDQPPSQAPPPQAVAAAMDFLSGSPVKNRAIHNMNTIGLDNAGAGAGAGDDNLLGFAHPAPQLQEAQFGSQTAADVNNLLDFGAAGGVQQYETETKGTSSDLFAAAPAVAAAVAVAADPVAPQPPQIQNQALQPPSDPFGQDIFQQQPLPPPPQADPFAPVGATTPDSLRADPFAPVPATQDPFAGGGFTAAPLLSGASSVRSAPPAMGLMSSASMTSQDTIDSSSIAMHSLPNPEPSYSNPLMMIPSPEKGVEKPVASLSSVGDEFQSMAAAPVPLAKQSVKQDIPVPLEMTNNSPPKEQEITDRPNALEEETPVAASEANENEEATMEEDEAPPSDGTFAATAETAPKAETGVQTQPAASSAPQINGQPTAPVQDKVMPQQTDTEVGTGEGSVATAPEAKVEEETPPESKSPAGPLESPTSDEKVENAPETAEPLDDAHNQIEGGAPNDTQYAAPVKTSAESTVEAEKVEETSENDVKGDSTVKAEKEKEIPENNSKAETTDDKEQPPNQSMEEDLGSSEPVASSTQGHNRSQEQDADGEAAESRIEDGKAPNPVEPREENVAPASGLAASTAEPSNNDQKKRENDAKTSEDGGNPADTANEPEPTPADGAAVEATTTADRGESQEKNAEPVSWLATAKTEVNGNAPVQNELQTGKEEEAKEQVEENQMGTAQPQAPASSETQQESSVEVPSPGSRESDEPTDQEILESLTATESSTAAAPNPAVPDSSKDEENALLRERAESLEKQLAAAEALIAELQYTEAERKHENDSILADLQAKLQKQMTMRAEAKDAARLATVKSATMGEEVAIYKKETTYQIESITEDLAKAMTANASMKKELGQIRSERDEQARNEASLTTRLNTAKKKEGEIGYAAEVFEKRTDQLQTELTRTTEKLTTVTADRDCCKKDVANWKQFAEEKTQKLDSALKSERRHNDERKKKMKLFVERKTEEVRVAKSDHLSLQTELDQTNQTLKELNQRFKQLHTQWVESQTRCRELQRDITKMKKDSEKMSKVGGSLEAKLSRSAMQTEDHKNKRMAAKNELMALLRQLESEKEVSNRLRDGMRVTFTTKALSQQQTMSDALDAFEGALQRLALRLNRSVPQRNATGSSSNEQQAPHDGSNAENSTSLQLGFSDASTSLLLNKLETETQRVSDYVVAFVENVDRMNVLVDGSGSRNCVDALQKILVPGMRSQIASSEERTAISARRTSRGPRYGQIPANAELT